MGGMKVLWPAGVPGSVVVEPLFEKALASQPVLPVTWRTAIATGDGATRRSGKSRCRNFGYRIPDAIRHHLTRRPVARRDQT